MIKFVGQPVRLVFNSDSYKIFGFEVSKVLEDADEVGIQPNKYGNISVVGDLPDLQLYQDYMVTAEATEGGKYGTQYKVRSIYRDTPVSKQGKIDFLTDILPYSQAKELIEKRPDIIEDVIAGKDIDVSDLHNIKESRIEVIKRKIIENFGLIKLVEKYSEYGFTFEVIKALSKHYFSLESIEKAMKSDPYGALTGIDNIGFKKADAILLKVPKGVLLDEELITSVIRTKACIKHVLGEKVSEGHTKCNRVTLYEDVEVLVPESIKHFDVALADPLFYDDGEYAAMRYLHDEEMEIAERCRFALTKNTKLVPSIDLETYRQLDNFQLTDGQLSVLPMVNDNQISILTAPAGAGKSSGAKALINWLDSNGRSYSILAPTGKASKVISEYTGKRASTIHRYLGLGGVERIFDENHKIYVDVVVVDEFSMADVYLTLELLRSIDFAHTKLFIIADNYQLPSVGAGNILHDMLESEIIPVTRLDQIFRYGEGGLMQVATKIRNSEKYLGDGISGKQWFGTNKDYCFIGLPKERTLNYALSVYKDYIDRGKPMDEIILLSAYNDGEWGVNTINKHIQGLLFNDEDHQFIMFGENKYYVGDNVIQTSNNYGLKYADQKEKKRGVFNGEIGRVASIGKDFMVITYDGDDVLYEKGDMKDLKLAYAITIHRSQGSGFKNVIVVTPKPHTYMLNSNLLYVACTRAKSKVIHIGESDVINSCVKKKANLTRQTFLYEMLTDAHMMVPDFHYLDGKRKKYNQISVDDDTDTSEPNDVYAGDNDCFDIFGWSKENKTNF